MTRFEIIVGCSGIDWGGIRECVCMRLGESDSDTTYPIDHEPEDGEINILNRQGVVAPCHRGGQRYLTTSIMRKRD